MQKYPGSSVMHREVEMNVSRMYVTPSMQWKTKLEFKLNVNTNSSVHNACKLAYFGSGNGFALQQLCQ